MVVWSNVYQPLRKANKPKLSIEKRLEFVEEAIKLVDGYLDSSDTDSKDELIEWKEHLKLFLEVEPNTELLKQWHDEAKVRSGKRSTRKICKIYKVAYKEFMDEFYLPRKELIAAAKPGLNIEDRLKLISEIKNNLNINWRKNPDKIMKLLNSIEEVETKLKSFADANKKELLEYYVKLYSNKDDYGNKIYLVAFEEFLEIPPKTTKPEDPKKMSPEDLISYLEIQLKLLKKE